MAVLKTAKKSRTTKAAGNRKRTPVTGKVAAPKSKKKVPAKAKAKAKVKLALPRMAEERGSEVAGVLALGASVFLMAALFSLQFGNGMLMGPFGRNFAVLAYSLLGIGGYTIAMGGMVIAVRMLMEKATIAKGVHVVGASLGLVSITVILHLSTASYKVAGYDSGGLLGAVVGEFLRDLVSTAGTVLAAGVLLVVAVVIATPLRMRSSTALLMSMSKAVGYRVGTRLQQVAEYLARFLGEFLRVILPERGYWEEENDEEEVEDNPVDADVYLSGPKDYSPPNEEMVGDTEKVDQPHVIALTAHEEHVAGSREGRKSPAQKKASNSNSQNIVVKMVNEDSDPGKKEASLDSVTTEAAPPAEPVVDTAKKEGTGPMIVESKFKADAQKMKLKEAEAEEERLGFIKLQDGDYRLPSLDFLAFDEHRKSSVDKGAMLELSLKLVQTLENYGVKGTVAAIRPGPVVTMYEFAPAPGTRLNKIVNLGDDLAMSLEAMKVRIVAPIPGKAVVGIEVPNKSVEMVYLKEIIADDSFRGKKVSLPMALGKNIEGAPVSIDLAKMPHLMVAGTTGSGKSVSVNSMITSLLYSCSPEEVRMIMIDPKMLELSIYEGIPHLLLPVVTDPQKANLALRWAVDEMERRYRLLAEAGVRDIKSYNKKLEKKRAVWNDDQRQHLDEGGEFGPPDGEHLGAIERVSENDQVSSFLEKKAEPEKSLPFIVVVIDEFADLMMCSPKEVETSVARIAQKARAAGIHLILATQRPSVDVITGLIKANFPSRLAFRVSSKVDSRTVLDQSGAENLLGSGDMLFSDRGASPVRLHGCYVDEEEIHQIVEFLKTQGRPVYNLDIVAKRDDDDEQGPSSDPGSGDALYDQAVQIVAESRRVSVSYLQRRLSVGYNRSAKMVERMEIEGVVSPPDNKKQREVLIAAA